MTDELQPAVQYDSWDRQPVEPAKLFARFRRFCHLGYSRSLLRAYNLERAEVGKAAKRRTPSSWDAGCRAWHWRERAEKWDEEQRWLRQLRIEKAAEEAFDRQSNLAPMVYAKAFEDWEEFKIGDPSSKARLEYILKGMELERQLYGEPAEIVRQQHEGQPVNQLTFNLVDIVRQLREQAQLENQADGPARIAYQASANGHQVNGQGG